MDKRLRDSPVPGAPDTTEDSIEGQQALRLHARIAVIATLLCAFVTVVFVRLGSIALAMVFAVIGVGCVVVLGWALHRKRRGAKASATGRTTH